MRGRPFLATLLEKKEQTLIVLLLSCSFFKDFSFSAIGVNMSQQHTKAEKRTRRKRYQERVLARIRDSKKKKK